MASFEYYREPNGDYLAIARGSLMGAAHGAGPVFEGRAAALEGIAGSVCTTGVAQAYLSECERVDARDVPADWRRRIDG